MLRKNSRSRIQIGGVEQFLLDHQSILARIARAYSRNPDERSDLLQEIRYQIIKSFPSYQPERNSSTWLYRVALNCAISFRRKADRWSAPEMDWDSIPAPSPTDESDPRTEHLQRLIELLDPLHRALLVLYLDDLSHAEIAEVLGISVANVATRLSRIRQQLRSLHDKEQKV